MNSIYEPLLCDFKLEVMFNVTYLVLLVLIKMCYNIIHCLYVLLGGGYPGDDR